VHTLRPANLGATWSQRHVIVPAGKHAGPLGLRTRGALVVLVGTDGSGKSTVATEIASRLGDLGVTTSTAHMGMARGNLPGVGLARKLLGVKAETGDPVVAATSTSGPDPVDEDAPPAPLSHATIRKAAAWYYAGEYAWRWWRDVRPGLRHGGVVIADRYVYDLRESPWPGSRASRFAERMLPSPDVLVLPDAPAELIHARKPERPLREQREQQIRFASLLAEHPARLAEVVVDTSGSATSDDVAVVVAAVVEALHQP
jgi:thymidylate kinase